MCPWSPDFAPTLRSQFEYIKSQMRKLIFINIDIFHIHNIYIYIYIIQYSNIALCKSWSISTGRSWWPGPQSPSSPPWCPSTARSWCRSPCMVIIWTIDHSEHNFHFKPNIFHKLCCTELKIGLPAAANYSLLAIHISRLSCWLGKKGNYCFLIIRNRGE